MFRYTVKKHGISRMGGRAYSKNQDGAQTCRFCRLDVDDMSEPHSFITRVDRDRPQHRGAGGRFGRAVGRQQWGCVRYAEGLQHFADHPPPKAKRVHATLYLPYSVDTNGKVVKKQAECCSATFRNAFGVGKYMMTSLSTADPLDFEQT